MVWFGAVGGSCFVLACLVLGTRLLMLGRRSKEIPELTLGLGLLLMGGISYPLVVVARVVPDLTDGTRVALALTSQILMMIGVTSVGVFNWRVFRPASALAQAGVWGLAGGFAILIVLQAIDPGILAYARANEGIFQWNVPLTGSALWWAAFETWRYHSLLRRRHALGLADPMVLDRMKLWGITTAAASLINACTCVCQALGIDPATAPIASAITGVFGLICAGGLLLAFFPPAAYRRRVIAAG